LAFVAFVVVFKIYDAPYIAAIVSAFVLRHDMLKNDLIISTLRGFYVRH
jgi:hypothetical protein